MRLNMTDYERFKCDLIACCQSNDWEMAHITADGILCDIAISENLSLEEKKELIEIYDNVPKWFA